MQSADTTEALPPVVSSRWWALIAILAVAYFASGRLGLIFAHHADNATLLWAPTGISLACLLLFGKRLWPGVWLGAVAVNLAVGSSIPGAAVIATGNTLEAVVGALLVRRAVGARLSFQRLRDVLSYIIFGAALCTMISATVGVSSLWLAGEIPLTEFMDVWLVWWLGDAGGALVVGPAILVWANKTPVPTYSSNRLELGAAGTLLVAAPFLIFGEWLGPASHALPFLPIPVLIWVSMRFGPRGAASAVLIVCAFAVYGTARGLGPLAVDDIRLSLFLLWLFMSVASVTALCFGALLSERVSAETELKRQQGQLRATNQSLQRALDEAAIANSAKSEFVAKISHEIRTPMTAILGYSEMMLADDKPPSERRDYLDTIVRNGQYLLHVINDILDISKIEAGRMPHEISPCSPYRIAADVATSLEGSCREGVCLQVDVDWPIPNLIASDPTRLRQILINLVGNAVKFTERGTILIELSTVERDGSAADIRLRVKDSGLGIPEDQLEAVFEPFHQTEAATGRRPGGTGLGLAIAKSLVEVIGGVITVRSAQGVGTTFDVTLPIGKPAGLAMVHRPEDLRIADRQHRGPAGVSVMGRVLLAEDAIDSQRLLTAILSTLGADVTVASHGGEAVDMAMAAAESGQPFDLILMDMQMPILDGYEATARLRDLGYGGPIVALTADAMAGQREVCLRAGCNDYATKPIDQSKLHDLLTSYLMSVPTQASLADPGQD